MVAMSASEVRREWSAVMDSVVRSKPAFIKRTRDYMVLCSSDFMAQIVSGVRYTADQYTEEDGSVTLSLREIDLIVNGRDAATARSAMARDIMEYAEEYYNEFELYSNTLNRREQIPYVIKALTAKTPEEVEAALECRAGET